MILLKAILGGIVAVIVMWIIVAVFHMWRMHVLTRQRGIAGLGAVTSGESLLLHTPLVIVLLTVAFGIGLYLASR